MSSDSEYGNESEEEEEFHSNRNRGQSEHEKLYGVFLDDEVDDEVDERRSNGGGVNGKKGAKGGGGGKGSKGSGGGDKQHKFSSARGISFASSAGKPLESNESSDEDVEETDVEFRQMLGTGSAPVQAPPSGESEPFAAMSTSAHSSHSRPIEKPTWEKHTKGFGMKMLLSMGYKGGGLGKEGKGISRHVEVAGPRGTEGLGKVKEGTSLTANKIIERELQGKVGAPEMDVKVGAERSKRQARLRVAAEATAEEGLWRKGRSQKAKKPRYTTSNEVISGSGAGTGATSMSSVVLDMRGPQTRLLSSVGDIGEVVGSKDEVLLGQELLHNLSLQVDMVEAKLRNFDEQQRSTDERRALLERDTEALKSRVASGHEQLTRFREMESILQKTEAASSPDQVMECFQALCHPRFGKEYALFGMVQLAPALVAPVLERDLKEWDPTIDLHRPARLLKELRPMFTLVENSVLAARGLAGFETMADAVVVSRVRSWLLREWVVTSDPQSAVALIEHLTGLVSDASLSDLLRLAIFPKLKRAVESWDARSAAALSWGKDARMDLWLLPWLPLLRAELEPLIPTIRRKVLAALGTCELGEASYRQQDFLRPWMPVLGPRAAEAMAMHVGGCLAAHVRKVVINPADQKLDALDAAVSWGGVLPPVHLSCLLRGELFPNWHTVLVSWVARTDASANSDLVAWYKGWKSYFTAKGCLDDGVRAELGHALAIMRAGRQLPPSDFERTWKQDSSSRASYAQCLQHFTAQEKSTDAASAGETKQPQSRVPVPESFKEVVAAFAESRGVDFSMKAARNQEGRSLYDFGGKTILIEQDMVYISVSGIWKPVALEELC